MTLPTREEIAEIVAKVFTTLRLEPQGRWDADVVEFETKSASFEELSGWIADALRADLQTLKLEANALLTARTELKKRVTDVDSLYDATFKNLEQVRADLHACAEALTRVQTFLDRVAFKRASFEQLDEEYKALSVALARPGVRDALK